MKFKPEHYMRLGDEFILLLAKESYRTHPFQANIII